MHIALVLIPIHQLTGMALFVSAAGLYFFFAGSRLFARRRSRARIPASTIREASRGAVAVSGIATGPYTLAAPVTGKPCFLYQTTIWQQSGSSRNQRWEKVTEEVLHLPFFVEDSTGQLLVEPLAAELDLQEDFRQEYGSGPSSASADGMPPRVSVFLGRHGIVQGSALRVEERSIAPQTPVFISGMLLENPGICPRPFVPRTESPRASAVAAPSGPAPEVIQLSDGNGPSVALEMTQQQKIAAALTRAGITKPEAWAAAGVPSGLPRNADSLPASDIEASEDDGIPSVILIKGADATPFLISSHGRQEVIGSSGWKSVAMLVGGVGLTMLGVYVLLLERSLR